MPFRLGLLLTTLVIAASPLGRAGAQSSASATVRATVRQSRCPMHSSCRDNPGPGDDKPGKGNDTSGTGQQADERLHDDVGIGTDVRPLRVVIRSSDASSFADARRLASGPATTLSAGPSLPWLYALPLLAATARSARGGIVTFVFEY